MISDESTSSKNSEKGLKDVLKTDGSIRCSCHRHSYEEGYKLGFYCSLDKAASRFQDIMEDLDHKLRKYIRSNEKSPKSRNSERQDGRHSKSKSHKKSSKDSVKKEKRPSTGSLQNESSESISTSNFLDSSDVDNFDDDMSQLGDACDNEADLQDIFENFEQNSIDVKKVDMGEEEIIESVPKPPKRRTAHSSEVIRSDSCPVPKKRQNIREQLAKRYDDSKSETTSQPVAKQLTASERVSKNKSSSFQTKPKFNPSAIQKRLAHQPAPKEVAMLPISMSSDIPLGVRQKYLKLIFEEYSKLELDSITAKDNALQDEKRCLERSRSKKPLYVNNVVKCVQNLRADVKNKEKEQMKNRSLTNSGPALVTHLQVLAGKKGTIGTWSIEKPMKLKADLKSDQDIPDHEFYQLLQRYVLTIDQLKESGFPIALGEHGEVTIEDPNRFFDAKGVNLQPKDPFRRRCDRCHKIYEVDDKGHQVMKDEYGSDVKPCNFHWGRKARTKGSRAHPGITVYLCCQGDSMSTGCSFNPKHFTDMISATEGTTRTGYVETMPMDSTESSYPGIYALDCEMCSTTMGNELTRVTVINLRGQTVYESMVLPANEIIDYNTRFSGITSEQLDGVTTKLRDVQAVLLSKFSSETILIGHSLESDLKALKIAHKKVVDTVIVYPHKMGPPYKMSLRQLSLEYLKRIIQESVDGHDSAEDALAALDLMKYQVMEDYKKLHQKRV